MWRESKVEVHRCLIKLGHGGGDLCVYNGKGGNGTWEMRRRVNDLRICQTKK